MVKDFQTTEMRYVDALRTQLLLLEKGDPTLKADFDMVMNIHANANIGLSTAKRFLKIDQTNPGYRPSLGTLKKLARHVGYEDWKDFIQKNKLPPPGNPINNPVFAPPPRQTIDISPFGLREPRWRLIARSQILTGVLLAATTIVTFIFFGGMGRSGQTVISAFGFSNNNTLTASLPPPLGNKIEFLETSSIEAKDFVGIWHSYFDVRMKEVNAHKVEGGVFKEGSIHVPKGFKIIKVEYFLGGRGYDNCYNTKSMMHKKRAWIEAEIHPNGKRLSWSRIYAGLPCVEVYRVFWRRVDAVPKAASPYARELVEHNMNWLWNQKLHRVQASHRALAVGINRGKLGFKSGKDCICEALKEIRRLGNEKLAIKWLEIYHGIDFGAMTGYARESAYTIFYLFTRYSMACGED